MPEFEGATYRSCEESTPQVRQDWWPSIPSHYSSQSRALLPSIEAVCCDVMPFEKFKLRHESLNQQIKLRRVEAESNLICNLIARSTTCRVVNDSEEITTGLTCSYITCPTVISSVICKGVEVKGYADKGRSVDFSLYRGKHGTFLDEYPGMLRNVVLDSCIELNLDRDGNLIVGRAIRVI
jgi:hypothetical protein